MANPTRAAHWQQVYDRQAETAVSWFEEEASVSLGLIARHAAPDAAILDAGGGAARLVDGLLARGFTDVTVLDVSDAALAAAQARLGELAEKAQWIQGDLTEWTPPRQYVLWHDRAVFHFMTTPEDRAAYVHALLAGLAPGGIAVIATFALDGPEKCSGLPICRYSPESLIQTLDDLAPGTFVLEEALSHIHRTPAERAQSFQVSVLRRCA